MLLRLLAIAASVPPRETQVAVKHRRPKPLRPSVAGLCQERLALAHCDCQSRNNHKAKEDRMRFRPLHDRVVVKRIDAEDKTAGGIIIPDSAKEKPSQGEITAGGPGGRRGTGERSPNDLQAGVPLVSCKWM